MEEAAIALDRIRGGLAAKSLVIVGLRGTGKTVLLNRIARDAEGRGFAAIFLEAPEDLSLPSLLAPALRVSLLKMSRSRAAAEAAKRALRALGGFVRSMKLSYADMAFEVDLGSEPGLADSGDLQHDLGELLQTCGEAARVSKTTLTLAIDELQYVQEDQLGALIAALHRTAQLELPVTLVGAGLPQLVALTGSAKSYAERLFRFVELGPLEAAAAAQALEEPAQRLGVSYTEEAVGAILRRTQSYPYFLQEWGKHCWDCADESPIEVADVRSATATATAELDASFFRVRYDRLTPSEKHYLRAMAELGPGPHRSGEAAQALNKPVQSAAPVKSKLIAKGMIYSPAHGDTAFTVPMFDEYLRRLVPRSISADEYRAEPPSAKTTRPHSTEPCLLTFRPCDLPNEGPDQRGEPLPQSGLRRRPTMADPRHRRSTAVRPSTRDRRPSELSTEYSQRRLRRP